MLVGSAYYSYLSVVVGVTHVAANEGRCPEEHAFQVGIHRSYKFGANAEEIIQEHFDEKFRRFASQIWCILLLAEYHG